uniref:Uncharacterized protein n=1 Tax=Lupinus angustifolius TaxID=3871 RepID=L0P2F2_LUPAN|nr:hypothetical protein [Lupinus angustifolius]
MYECYIYFIHPYTNILPINYSEITESTCPITNRFERTKLFLARIYDPSVPKELSISGWCQIKHFLGIPLIDPDCKKGCQRSSSLHSQPKTSLKGMLFVGHDLTSSRNRGITSLPLRTITKLPWTTTWPNLLRSDDLAAWYHVILFGYCPSLDITVGNLALNRHKNKGNCISLSIWAPNSSLEPQSLPSIKYISHPNYGYCLSNQSIKNNQSCCLSLALRNFRSSDEFIKIDSIYCLALAQARNYHASEVLSPGRPKLPRTGKTPV